jgi:hypothetical protein
MLKVWHTLIQPFGWIMFIHYVSACPITGYTSFTPYTPIYLRWDPISAFLGGIYGTFVGPRVPFSPFPRLRTGDFLGSLQRACYLLIFLDMLLQLGPKHNTK